LEKKRENGKIEKKRYGYPLNYLGNGSQLHFLFLIPKLSPSIALHKRSRKYKLTFPQTPTHTHKRDKEETTINYSQKTNSKHHTTEIKEIPHQQQKLSPFNNPSL